MVRPTFLKVGFIFFLYKFYIIPNNRKWRCKTMNNLTQKEKMYLQEQKQHEEWCIKKYQMASEQAEDQELKTLFGTIKTHEETHLNTINDILSGKVPNINQAGATQQPNANNQYFNKPNPGGKVQASQKDIDLCFDLLNTEKYVSSTYNTAVFEFNDHQIRNTLNHIQKEEQEHGEKLYNYLKSKNAYNPQAQA